MRNAWVFLYLGSAGCLFPSLDEYGACSNGACDPPAGPGGASSSSSAGGNAGNSSGGGGAAGSGGLPDCAAPLGRGPNGVRATPMSGSPFCIDSTEVSFGDYRELVNELDGMSDAEFDDYRAAECETLLIKSSASFKEDELGEPSVAWTLVDQGQVLDRPAIEVSWCEAFAYCRWAGKALCGHVGGGPAVINQWDTHQWVEACTAGDLTNNPYGYGAAYERGECEAYDEPRAATECYYVEELRPATPNLCEGGYAGLYNMSGNTYEWTDDCDAEGCYPLGGACPTGEFSRCFDYELQPRSRKNVYIGFRCCWPAEGS